MNKGQKELIEQIRRELGVCEDTEHLIDWLLDAWDTFEVLTERFGKHRAMQFYTASVSLSQESEQPEAVLMF